MCVPRCIELFDRRLGRRSFVARAGLMAVGAAALDRTAAAGARRRGQKLLAGWST